MGAKYALQFGISDIFDIFDQSEKTTKGGMIMLTWQADLEAYVVRHGGRHVQFRTQMWDVVWNLSGNIGEACDLFLIVGS